LEDIKQRNATHIVNLGDILYGPIAPKATYELLMKHQKDITTIRGNQDRQIYEATTADINSNPTLQFIVEDLPNEAIQWMKGLPFDYELDEDVYLCHGSPTDDMVCLLENVETGQPIVRSDSDILSLLNDIDKPIILCGHTHTPRMVKLSTGQIVINTGSVGYLAYTDDLPVVHKMQNYSPDASYALVKAIETEQGKHWKVEHIKVPYDFEAAAKLALENNRKDWEFALRTGRTL
uniref:metallophosphoesterase family protein n=1 Tax=uncultured Psychrobacter sp. TaxID=259303 RepID=UPI0025941D49